MSWRLAMELYEAKLVGTQRGGGTWLSARQMSSARAWCKRLSLGKQGLSWQWEEPLAMGEQGSTRGKPCWVLARGLYQAQSAGANDAGVYQVFVAVGGEGKESKFFMEFEEAWGYALGAGLVEVPPEEELWGRVRSLCAQQQWQQVEEQVLRFVAAADVRSRLSRYRSEVRRQWYNALERELGLAQLQGEGPEAEVEQAQEHRAAYAKLYARVKQAQARVEALDAGQLQKSAHKACKKHMKQLEEKLEKERRWRWWSTGMGLWAMEEQAQQLEELAAALEAGQPVVKKQRRRVETDEASVGLVQDRQAPELHERLRARRKETGQLQGALEAQLGIKKGRLGEWEFAARGGDGRATYNGELTLKGERDAPELDDIAVYGGNSGVQYEGGFDCSEWKEKQYKSERCGPAKVRSKAANAYGLYDMLGNVWEWTWDAYKEEASGDKPGGGYSNTNLGALRVFRGCSWLDKARFCRAAARSRGAPGYRYGLLGLRPARSDR